MPAPSLTIAATNAHRVLRFGEARGFDRGRELRASWLPDPGELAARIPAATMYELWAELARRLGTPDLPIELAQRSQLEDLDVLGFVLVTAPTVLDAMRAFARYGALLNENGRWDVHVGGATVEARWTGAMPRSLGERLSREAALSQLVRGVRQLCGPDVDPLRVAFRHRSPGRARAHRAFFRAELMFEADLEHVVFRRDVCEIEPPGRNPALFAYLQQHADALLAQLGPRSLRVRVEEELARLLSAGDSPDMQRVARALGLSERTLRRGLATEGVRFRALVDETRRRRAERALSATPGSVARAAFEAGFADASAFSHACRRWFAEPPSALRRRIARAGRID